jgi:hypothetical protein
LCPQRRDLDAELPGDLTQFLARQERDREVDQVRPMTFQQGIATARF